MGLFLQLGVISPPRLFALLSQVDDSGNSIFTVLGRDMAADLRKVKSCAICYGEPRATEPPTWCQEANVLWPALEAF